MKILRRRLNNIEKHLSGFEFGVKRSSYVVQLDVKGCGRMSISLNQLQTYTYADYMLWPEGERLEIIEGEAYNMTPSPSRIHQKVSGALFFEIYAFLKGKTCEVYSAPFDVRLFEGVKEDKDIRTVVQPDIVVVCDPNKLDERGCKGSPDLIVEIVSPSSIRLDLKTKLRLYEKYKIKEYWVVYPLDKVVMVYIFDDLNGKYTDLEIYTASDQVRISIFEDLEINLTSVFQD